MESTSINSLQYCNDKLGVYIASINPALQYSAVFVPQSQSRNKESKVNSLNWIIKINNFETNYMQGVGHIPNYQKNYAPYLKKVIGQHLLTDACEKGIYHSSIDSRFNGKKLPEPKIEDVLYSLVMDCDVLNYNDFKDWAENFGYNPDSIKDNKIYRDCIKNALALRNMLGEKILSDLQVLFQDY